MSKKQMHNNSKRIVVYTLPNCNGCDDIKISLLKRGIEFAEVDCSEEWLMCFKKGIFEVPAVEIEGKIYRGKEAFKAVRKIR